MSYSKILTPVSVLALTLALTGCFSRKEVSFHIRNQTERPLVQTQIIAQGRPCSLVNFSEEIAPGGGSGVSLGVSGLANKCLSDQHDGSYTLRYMIGGLAYETEFGYYTNGLPLAESFDISVLAPAKVSINGREQAARIASNLPLDKLPQSFAEVTSYAAGEYAEDESLTFDNPAFREINHKNNPFYENWLSVRSAKQSGDLTVKTTADKNGDTIYVVERAGEKIYESRPTLVAVEELLKNLVTRGDDWWLLYIENRRSLNPLSSAMTRQARLVQNGEELDLHDVFELADLDGKIFYFFQERSDTKIKYALDGKIYQTVFDKIIHDRCCEPAAFNPRLATDGRLSFWGVQDGQFSYHEALLPGFPRYDQRVIANWKRLDTTKIQLTFENNTDTNFIYGDAYELYELSDETGAWQPVPVLAQVGWHDIAHILAAPKTGEPHFTDTLDLEKLYGELADGHYKIVKKFHKENDAAAEQVVAVEFDIDKMAVLTSPAGKILHELVAQAPKEIKFSDIAVKSFHTSFNALKIDTDRAFAVTATIASWSQEIFSSDSNIFTKQKWQPVPELSFEFFGRYGWFRGYEQNGVTCFVSMVQKLRGEDDEDKLPKEMQERLQEARAGCDPDADCGWVAHLDITCWDTQAGKVAIENQKISWERATELVRSGQVQKVFQTHDLAVELQTQDGQKYATTEPKIDAIFEVIKECGEPCAKIVRATE